MALEHAGAADIPSNCPRIPVPSDVHDAALVDLALGRRGDEPGAQWPPKDSVSSPTVAA